MMRRDETDRHVSVEEYKLTLVIRSMGKRLWKEGSRKNLVYGIIPWILVSGHCHRPQPALIADTLFVGILSIRLRYFQE